jgi:hypothetical protein
VGIGPPSAKDVPAALSNTRPRDRAKMSFFTGEAPFREVQTVIICRMKGAEKRVASGSFSFPESEQDLK